MMRARRGVYFIAILRAPQRVRCTCQRSAGMAEADVEAAATAAAQRRARGTRVAMHASVTVR